MLYLNTVTPRLESTLQTLISAELFDRFRLVGGTSLSLQLGHRMSDDIDLFTDELYGSIDFKRIDDYLIGLYPYVVFTDSAIVGMGKSYRVGNNLRDSVKLDFYFTDPFIRDVNVIEGIRMASIDDVVAMKMDVVQRGGRKKDFWDLHELLSKYTLDEMLSLHEERYPYSHEREQILANFANFERADDDIDPKCLRGKYWEVVKQELTETLTEYQHKQ